MGDLVNLKQIKKRNERMDRAKQAEANRARFGRTKAEKQRDQAAASRAASHLDQHRLDSEDSK